MNSSEIKITFEKKDNSSMAYDGDKQIGQCHFARLKEQWVITLTDIEKDYRGQGIGKKLVERIIDEARKEKVKIVPTCSYAKKLMLENPKEYEDVL